MNDGFKTSFWIHFVTYVFVIGLLYFVNVKSSPDDIWIVWPAIGWGIGVVAHGATAYLVGHFSKSGEEETFRN